MEERPVSLGEIVKFYEARIADLVAEVNRLRVELAKVEMEAKRK